MNKLKWSLLLLFIFSSLEMAAAFAADVAALHATAGASASAPESAPTSTEATTSTRGATPSLPLPAVSNLNGWIDAAADYVHNRRQSGLGGLAEAGIATPLTADFAAQAHGILGTNIQSADGYVFWRDPDLGLVAPHVMHTWSTKKFHTTMYGLRGDAFLETWTLTAEAGWAHIHNGGATNNSYGEGIINWYPQPDWKLYGGVIFLGGNPNVQVGTEYEFCPLRFRHVSFFADAGMGAHNINFWFVGLRYYLGDVCDPFKSLIRRHREDMVPSALYALSGRKH